jgi:PDZ domain
MSNKNFQIEENETLSGDDEKVRRMLGALPRVDAPNDFDFRVKARIAAAKPEDFKPRRLFPVLRYVAPLALVVIILGVIVLNNLYSVDSNEMPIVQTPAENVNSQPKEPLVAETNSQTPNAPIGASNKIEVFPEVSKNELVANSKKTFDAKPNAKNDGGGSKVDAVKNSRVITPPGIVPNVQVEAPQDLTTTYAVKDVLSFIGINATFADKKWKVNSVQQNSPAARSGVRTGDVIEAIDENRLASETISTNSKGTFSGKKLTVARGGEKLEIELQNK